MFYDEKPLSFIATMLTLWITGCALWWAYAQIILAISPPFDLAVLAALAGLFSIATQTGVQTTQIMFERRHNN